MKGMMSFLERTGLVRKVGDDGELSPEPPLDASMPPGPAEATLHAPSTMVTSGDGLGLSLDQVFAHAGVAPCAYPAERLLRLLDGLKAMDEPTRRQAIQAMDAADDSWTIEDPMRDAAAKVAAIERHAATLREGVARAEKQTQAQLQAVAQRQESTVADIRRQITDLEGLLAREVARGTQEGAALEAALKSQRDDANRELASLSQAAQALTGLVAQFGSRPANR